MWAGLSSRERLIISVAIPVSLLVVGYLYAWQPIQDRLERLRLEVPQKSAELAWIKNELGNSAHLLGNQMVADHGPILTIIEKRAIETRIKPAIQRVQPQSNDQVQIWFNEVFANNWFVFVKLLLADGIQVESATLTRTKNGNVNARVTFSR